MKTQKKAFISLFLCVFIVFWGVQVLAQDWTPEQKEVWSMQKKEWDLWKKGDMDAFKRSVSRRLCNMVVKIWSPLD